MLRLIAIQEKPFWIDEAWTLYFAHTYSYQKLLLEAPVFNDIHPGLYYTIVKSLLVSSPGLETLRAITSFLPQSVALLAFLFWCLRRKLAPLTVLLSVGALSLSPFLIHYSWQLRMYSLTLLWTSIISIITADFLFHRSSWSTLYLLLPLFILANITDMNGYPLALSVWTVIFIIKIILPNASRRETGQFMLWTACLIIATGITLAPYIPFRAAQLFHRASWLAPPSGVYALRAFPLTTLGLDTSLFPNNGWGLAWPAIAAIGILIASSLLCIWFLRHVSKKVQRIYSTVLILLFLVPAGGYIFSHVSPMARYIPLLRTIVPPISIYLPRFFVPQALLLHIVLAITLSYCIQKGRAFVRSLAIIVIITTLIVWTLTYQTINMVTDTDTRTSLVTNETMKTIDPVGTIFYPGYFSLFMLHPKFRTPPQSVASSFANSNRFEEAIKTNAGNTYCAQNKQDKSFSLFTTMMIPSFFSPFAGNLNDFTRQFCQALTKDNNDSIVYTCRCLTQTKLDNDK